MAKAKKAAKPALVQVILVSRIKEVSHAANVRVSGDFLDAVNAAVVALVKKAVDRAKANGRHTVRPQDI